MAGGSRAGRDPLEFSVFTYPELFRFVMIVKAVATGLLYGAIVFGAALWFEVSFNHATASYVNIVESTGWVRWWVDHGIVPVPSACIASLVFLVGLRIGSSLPGGREPSRGWLIGGAALYLAAGLLGAWALARCPGSLLARWLPFGIAVVLPWRLRRLTIWRVRRPTVAGFRPSWLGVLSFRGYIALENLDKALPTGWLISTNIADTTPDESAAVFRRRRDYRSQAYCIARAVEYLLAHNRIKDAEARVRAVPETAEVFSEPAFKAARAEFLAAVGQYDRALRLLREARDYGHPPVQLDALILAVVIDSGRYGDSPESRWSEWRRATLVWKRQPNAVILGLAADAWLTAPSDPASAMKLAYQICRLPDQIALILPGDSYDLGGYGRTRMAKGLALDTLAQVYARRGQHFDAASAFIDAYREFESIKDRRRAGRCLVLSYTNAMIAGYDSPEQENHALDMIRVGLQVVEDDRGTLRGEDSRVGWIASQRELYAAVFQQLSAVRYQQAKAAELGLWLLESLHRSLTADLLVAHGAIDANLSLAAALADLAAAEASVLPSEQAPSKPKTPEQLMKLRRDVRNELGSVREAAILSDATDTEVLLTRLGDRTAILYHCWQADSGWTIHSVLASAEHGIHVHCGHIQVPSAGTTWLTAAGAFDAIAAGDEQTIDAIFNGVPLDDPDFPLWEDIALALFPGSWRKMLRPAPGSHAREVLIVPDGPIASLPLGALPARGGRPLLESVSFALVPALSMLDLPDTQRERPPCRRVAVVHRDDRGVSRLPQTAREAEHWLAASGRMRVIETADQTGIEDALDDEPPPDIIVISTHGILADRAEDNAQRAFSAEVRLRDGTVLSEESAMRLRWPPTVILASCWVGAASAGTGREPSGFPLSCLLRGATTVIGGAAPISDEQTADVLCWIIDEIPSRADTLFLLQQAQAAVVRGKPLSEVTAAQIGALTAWTTAPAKRAGGWPVAASHWDTRGLPRAETATTGTLIPGATFSEASKVVLANARHLAAGQPVGTLEFLASAFAADSADWAGFAVACETGEPTLPGPVKEDTAGTVSADLGHVVVTVTVPLANALHRGQVAASLIGDQTMLPAHVILAAVADDTTAAGRWIRRDPKSAAADWPRHLSDRIFGADLPDPDAIFGPGNGGAAATHDKRMAGTSITKVPAFRRGKHQWLLPAAIAVLLLALPASYSWALTIQVMLNGGSQPPLPSSHTYIGVVLESVKGGTLIEWVQPFGPASLDGLEAGDVITAIGGYSDQSSPRLAIALIGSHPPGQTVAFSILRHGQPITVYVTTGYRNS